MKNSLVAFFSGVLFALGLGLAGMTKPENVIGFLNVFHHWNPSLAFVMGGAIVIHFVAYRFVAGWNQPLADTHWHIPKNRDITVSLVLGATIFGIGWGLVGYCPGPGIVALVTFKKTSILFVLSMMAGIWMFKKTEKPLRAFFSLSGFLKRIF